VYRRDLLAAGGLGLAGLAGCLDTAGTDASTPSGTPTDTDTSTPSGTPTGADTATPAGNGAALSVTVERLQPAVVELMTPDSIGVSGGEDTQYLSLRLDVTDGDPPAREALTFRFDGESHGLVPVDRQFGLWRQYNHGQDRYDADRGAGWALFELPATGDADDAALVWPGGEWRPDATLRDRLAAPAPPFAVEWSVPETVPVNAEPEIEFTVGNEGERDGCWVAALNRTGGGIAYMPVAAIRKPVPAGETVTWTVTDTYGVDAPSEAAVGDGEPDMTYKISRTDGRSERDVRIVGV